MSLGASSLSATSTYTSSTEKNHVDSASRAQTTQPQAETPMAPSAKTSSTVPPAKEAQAASLQPDSQDQQADAGPLDVNELRALIDEVNSTLYSMNRSLRFEVHDKTEDLVVHVVNTKTDEVIRQYPSEDVLQRRERLLEGEVSAFTTRVD